MDVELSGYEVLEIAERIERNGSRFYRKAAGLCDDPETSALFVKLAQWEARHIDIFRRMRDRVADQRWQVGKLVPDRVGLPDVQALAGLTAFGMGADPQTLSHPFHRRFGFLPCHRDRNPPDAARYTTIAR